jgi:hypothetical protein
MVEIAARQRHLLLLKKVRNNQPLTAGELKELEEYEHGMAAKKTKKTAAKKRPAKGKRQELLTELAELAVSPKVTPAMAADKLGMTAAAFEKFLQEDQEAGRVWRHAQIDALTEVGKKLCDKAKGGDAAAARQILQGLQEKIGTGGDLRAMAPKAVAALVGEKPARLDYWYRKHGMPKNLDGTIDLQVFLEWYRRHLIAEHTFDPMRVKTVPELEPLVGVSKVTVFEWLKQGLPRNADKSFSLPAVFKWMIERVGSRPQQPAIAVNPLADKKARKLQIEIEQAEKKLVPRLSVEMGFIFYASAFHAVLERKEGELPGLLADCKGEEEIMNLIRTHFEQIRQVVLQMPDDIAAELPAAALERMKRAMDVVIEGSREGAV